MISRPPTKATAAPTPTPITSSPIAPHPSSCSPATTPSAVAAAAMQNVTTGVAMPSLRPLSTLRTRRTRAGRRSSPITDALSAASVGARLAAIRPARASGRLGNRTTATAVPARIDSGRPMANKRPVSGRSRRAAAGGTAEASPNSNRASVSSASAWTVGPSTSTLPIPQSEFARNRPATMKTSGPVRS